MAIRPARSGDVAAVRRVAERSWERDYPDVVSRETAEAGVGEWYDEARIAGELDRPDAVLLVAEREVEREGEEREVVLGFCHGVYSDREGHLMRVYVDPAHRGEGLGSELVEAARDRLFERGAERVRAMVLADNEPGNAFYRSLGFERLPETYETEVGGEYHEERVWVAEP